MTSSLLSSETLHVGYIQIDPKKNVSRAGRWLDGEHPDVKRMASGVGDFFLLQPVGLRLLEEPVPRPCGGKFCCGQAEMARDESDGPTEHLVEIRYGFVRLSALLSLGRTSLRLAQPSVEANVHETMSDEEAERACVIENSVRTDVTDYQLAQHVYAVMQRPEYAAIRNPYERAALYRETYKVKQSVGWIDDVVRILERCPGDLLDEWDKESTTEMRRTLDAVSRVDGERLRPESERHEAMRRRFVELREEAARAAERAAERKAAFAAERAATAGRAREGGPPAESRVRPSLGSPTLSRSHAERLLGRLDLAREVYDDVSGGYVPLSDESRAHVRAVLRHLLSGRKTSTEPLR